MAEHIAKDDECPKRVLSCVRFRRPSFEGMAMSPSGMYDGRPPRRHAPLLLFLSRSFHLRRRRQCAEIRSTFLPPASFAIPPFLLSRRSSTGGWGDDQLLRCPRRSRSPQPSLYRAVMIISRYRHSCREGFGKIGIVFRRRWVWSGVWLSSLHPMILDFM